MWYTEQNNTADEPPPDKQRPPLQQIKHLQGNALWDRYGKDNSLFGQLRTGLEKEPT